MISADDLAWGNLSRFDAIVTGVRAYERRDDLRANNSRLLDYVNNGGTLIVQYNKFEFNDAQYGPYPAKVSATASPTSTRRCKCWRPHDPLLNAPNKIGDAAWKGWVQERGLYFLGDQDSRYHDLLADRGSVPVQQGREARRARRGARTARAAGCTSASACGASCRPASTARISCSRT